MTDNPGRTASVLRVVVLLLLGGMCYQLGYNAGFTNGNWESRRQHLWETVGRSSVEPSASDDPAAVSATSVDLSDLDGGSAPNGIVLCPPVVLPPAPKAVPDRVAQAHHTSHPLAAASVIDPRF